MLNNAAATATAAKRKVNYAIEILFYKLSFVITKNVRNQADGMIVFYSAKYIISNKEKFMC